MIKEYDKNNNLIHYKNSNGLEFWQEFDEKNNCIYYKDSNGYEDWYKWENNKRVQITQQEFKQIERAKLYLNNKKCSRFEIMDI